MVEKINEKSIFFCAQGDYVNNLGIKFKIIGNKIVQNNSFGNLKKKKKLEILHCK